MRIPLTLLLLTLATPASAGRSAPPSDSPLHAYVIGRYAVLDNDVALASRLLEEARAARPGSANVTRRAWDLAIIAGDQPRAFQLARSLAAAGEADPDSIMTQLAEAVIRKDWPLAARLRQALGTEGWPMVAGPIIDAWLAAARGDSAAALLLLDPERHQGFMRSYIAEQRAHLLASLGRWDEAATAYRAARGGVGGAAVLFLRQGHADALAMAGRRDEALAVLYPGDRPTALMREQMLAGKRLGPVAADARQGLAWLSVRLAGDLARERAEPMALLFARLSTFLAPELPISWITAGDALGRAGQTQPALAALDRVPGGLGLDEAMRARRAEVLAASGQDVAAGALLQAAAAAPDATAADWQSLANWHRRSDRFQQAATAYGTAIDRFGQSLGPAVWNLHYLRAMMRDRAGDWPGAESDLREALRLYPNEPGVLNYLGYSLLEKGHRLPEARALIEQAAALRPGDGGVIDSLGWMQLQAGEVDAAVATLERAVSLEPLDPTVISHLGDALWQQGRRIEARHRWRQALGLGSDADLQRGLQARLDYGLDAAPAMLAQR